MKVIFKKMYLGMQKFKTLDGWKQAMGVRWRSIKKICFLKIKFFFEIDEMLDNFLGTGFYVLFMISKKPCK